MQESSRKPSAIVLCHLPDGPTAFFKINSLKFTEDLKVRILCWRNPHDSCFVLQRKGESTEHLPEVILNNFNTRLGHTIGRMLACLFPHAPEFRGRRVVTFHNQRDYIFFRHHRWARTALR